MMQKNILNCDETGLFYKAMPNKSLTLCKEDCKCGKKSKDNFTMLFSANATQVKHSRSLTTIYGRRDLILP
jgi:hypothetical protein